MYRQLKAYFAVFLLLVLSATIIPAETFHHHEEATVVCHESSNHFEAPHFKCDLCDFVLPFYEVDFKSYKTYDQVFIAELEQEVVSAPQARLRSLYKGRAPPYLG